MYPHLFSLGPSLAPRWQHRSDVARGLLWSHHLQGWLQSSPCWQEHPQLLERRGKIQAIWSCRGELDWGEGTPGELQSLPNGYNGGRYSAQLGKDRFMDAMNRFYWSIESLGLLSTKVSRLTYFLCCRCDPQNLPIHRKIHPLQKGRKISQIACLVVIISLFLCVCLCYLITVNDCIGKDANGLHR